MSPSSKTTSTSARLLDCPRCNTELSGNTCTNCYWSGGVQAVTKKTAGSASKAGFVSGQVAGITPEAPIRPVYKPPVPPPPPVLRKPSNAEEFAGPSIDNAKAILNHCLQKYKVINPENLVRSMRDLTTSFIKYSYHPSPPKMVVDEARSSRKAGT